jgi:hypothetical protein
MTRPPRPNLTLGTGNGRRALRKLANVRQAHYAAPIGASALLTVLLGAALLRFHGTPVSSCQSLRPDAWPTAAFVAIVSAFLLGGVTGKLHPGSDASPGIWTHAALTLFAAVVALVWGYETWAIANPSQNHVDPQPITFYVMCVRSNESDWTLFVFVVAALLVGRWLWHRPRAARLRAGVADLSHRAPKTSEATGVKPPEEARGPS